MSMNFGGVFWTAGRGRDVPTVRVARPLVRRVLAYFRPYRLDVTLALITTAAMAGMGLIPPLLIRAIDAVAIQAEGILAAPQRGRP